MGATAMGQADVVQLTDGGGWEGFSCLRVRAWRWFWAEVALPRVIAECPHRNTEPTSVT